VTNRPIIVGLAATFIGLTALLLVGGVIVSPVLLAVAVPFAVVSYFLWYHASGRLRDRVQREATRTGPTNRERARQRARAAENRRYAYQAAGTADGGEAGPRAGAGGGPRWGAARGPGASDPRDRAPRSDRMTERDAYETLGLDPSADQEAIRSAYRDRAKRLHPDTESGDESAFKRLNEAYEVLKR